MNEYTFNDEIDRFISHIKSLEKTLPIIMDSVNMSMTKASNAYTEYIRKNRNKIKFDETAENKIQRLLCST